MIKVDKNLKLNFGMYKDYLLGIVYTFDPGYIDWCLTNTKKFDGIDFTDILEYGVVNQGIDWQYREARLTECIYGLDAFDSFEELVDTIELEKRECYFENYQVKKETNKLPSNEPRKYPLAKFPYQIEYCKPDNFLINSIKVKSNGTSWINITTKSNITLLIEIGEIAADHNYLLKSKGFKIFDCDDEIKEGDCLSLRDDLKIGVEYRKLIYEQ